MKRTLSELSTYDWVRLRDFELIALGEDPTDRIRLTGHTRCVPEPYLATIGTWGAYEVHELVNDSEPHRSLVPVSEAAYRRFKARHRLLCRSQFARLHGTHAWVRAEICFLAYERVQRAFGDRGARSPLGVACDYARVSRICAPHGRNLGLMPVEVVLWTRVFDAMLADNGITAADWLALKEDDRTIVWDAGDSAGQPWGVQRFLHGPAVRSLADLGLAVAS